MKKILGDLMWPIMITVMAVGTILIGLGALAHITDKITGENEKKTKEADDELGPKQS